MTWTIRSIKWATDALEIDFNSSRLPDEGAPLRHAIRNNERVAIWVLSKQEKAEIGGLMRIMAQCPRCDKVVSAGRYDQHYKIHQSKTQA